MDLPATKAFHKSKPWTLYSSSGEVLHSQVTPTKNKRFSLNFYAPQMAVRCAQKRFGEDTCVFFTLLDKTRQQHVYYGTTRNAMNGKGGHPVEKGVINLTTWMARVLRKRQRNPASGAEAITKVRRHIQSALMVVEADLLTQAPHHRTSVAAHLMAACEEAGGLSPILQVKTEVSTE